MDTPEFGEVTKQKIGYRLREVLSGKKTKTRGETWQGRVYEFDEEKLKRIFKKYNCSFGNKFTSGTSLKGVAPVKNEAEAQEKIVSSQKYAAVS